MKLTKNLSAKILALVFAGVFWVFVVSTGEKIHSFAEPIEVQTFNVPEKVVVVNEQELGLVRVSVVAFDQDFSKLTRDDVSAYIDVGGLEIGQEQEVPVNVTLNDPNVKLYRVEPAKLTVRLDRLTSKSIPIEVESAGTIAAGYILGQVDTNDQRVRVEGAQSVVERVSRVVARVQFEGNEKSDIERQVKLLALDEGGAEVPQITLSPASVIVTADIEGVTKNKTVGVVVDLSDDALALGYWIKEVQVTPNSIQIQGDPVVLNRIENVLTEQIEVKNLSADRTFTVALIIPRGVTVASSTRQVTVSIALSSEVSTREMYAGIDVINVPAELTIAKIDPGSVKLKISGALPNVRDIEESSVKITIDAAGASEGVRRYSISPDAISVPQNVSIDSMIPREVRVTFEESASASPEV